MNMKVEGIMRIGFVVNPIAGMGGRVGLKGTDGVVKEAVRLGARPVAPGRAEAFLRELKACVASGRIRLVTVPGLMGEDEAGRVGLDFTVLPLQRKSETTAEDTKAAVKMLVSDEYRTDLIVFVGGDGTARDVLDALGSDADEAVVLGVPSGVKMYSGVFAINPSEAAKVVEAFVDGEADVAEMEVVDVDEGSVRKGKLEIRLYGYLKVPYLPLRIQGTKTPSPETMDEKENQKAIARFVIENMKPDATYILGPGTTVKAVADLLGVRKTLLGVDLYLNGRLIPDVNERTILETIEDWRNAWIIVSPIGGQGIIFGRGNQQISPDVIRKIGKGHIWVLATKNKVKRLKGILRIDTGDPEVDGLLKGYVKVLTDYREWRIIRVE